MNPARLKAYLMILGATAIWGIAGPVIKFTLGGIDALPFLTYRFAISAIICAFIFSLTGLHFPKSPKTILLLLIYALTSSSLSLGLLFFGLENTTVLEMTVITLTVPLINSIAGSYFLKEHITKRERIGMAIALAGTTFTVLEPLILNGGNEIRFSGNVILLLYILVNIVPTLLGKKLLRDGISPSNLTGYSFVVGFLSLVPILLWKVGLGGFINQITTLPIQYHLGVLFMAIASGNIAYYLFNKAQKTIEVGEASVFSYLHPIFTAPLALIWLGETITPKFLIGALIIVIGVVVAEYKKRRYN